MTRETLPTSVLPCLLLTLFATAAAAQPEAGDGSIQIVGSGSTVMPILELWKKHFAEKNPGVNVELSGEGTTWGPAALMSGRADVAAMSRRMTDGEFEVFRAKMGADPVAFPIALDAVAIYVHRDSPVQQLNLSQVDAIFSVSRRCGANRALRSWEDLKIGDFSGPIEIYGQGRTAGTGEWFQQQALCGGVLRDELREVGGRGNVAMAVAESPRGIGFETGARHIPGANVLALAPIDSDVGVPLQVATVRDGSYPLAREMFLYTKRPVAALGPNAVDFLKLGLSEEGQALVEEAGYVRLSEERLAESRSHLPQ